MDNSIDDILTARNQTHGDYRVNARITQDIKGVIQAEAKYHSLPPDMRETLDMIALKIGRILAGDPTVEDHWDDIAGYSRLVSNQLRRDKSWVESTPTPEVKITPKSTLSDALAKVRSSLNGTE